MNLNFSYNNFEENPSINRISPKPFVKWVGGKRQLLSELQCRFPKKFNSYYEPFVGGGALLFSMSNYDIDKIYINDYNSELINTYNVIRDNLDLLILSLMKHINDESYYYKQRELDRCLLFDKLSNIDRASRFIFLNKTSFNGLYRVNSRGHCNSPYGHYKNPKIVDLDNLSLCSKFLNKVNISTGDFELIKRKIKKGSFVYLDPPYAPLSSTSNFTSYTEKGFDVNMQIRLKLFCDYINSKGAYFMMSNSSSSIIIDMYKSYNIDKVLANRSVNCKAHGRGKIEELIIRNY